jgi:sec-independent protein translocase protein TatC
LWGVPFATLLFFIGVLFAWYILTPAAVGFLSTWQPEIFIQQWQSREYIPFVTSLVFWVGLSFETPLIIFIMTKLGLVTPQFLLKQWRFAIVIIAIAAAMITPTVDPFNMGLVMLPLIVLYGLSILLSYLA